VSGRGACLFCAPRYTSFVHDRLGGFLVLRMLKTSLAAFALLLTATAATATAAPVTYVLETPGVV